MMKPVKGGSVNCSILAHLCETGRCLHRLVIQTICFVTMENERTSSPPSSILMRFCDYLESRLQTENFDVFRRIISDFESHDKVSTTVDSMLRLAFPTVAVLPIDVVDPPARSHSESLLSCMKSEPLCENTARTRLVHEFRASVETRVVMKSGDWLEGIFEEFCRGEDNMLSVFVSRCRQAISIVPVEPLLPHDERALVNVSSADHVMGGKNQLEDISACPETRRNRACRSNVLHEYEAVEAMKPWDTVFDVLKMDLPTGWHEYPHLTTRLLRFWERNARAVWERNFWVRYPPDSRYDACRNDRRRRQDAAMRSFELGVFEPVYCDLGPQFFVDLDFCEERTSWWWYRRPVVDIMRLCDQQGVEASVEYLRSQAYQRFPIVPCGLKVRFDRHHDDGRSMWSTREKHQHMSYAIQDLKLTCRENQASDFDRSGEPS